MFSVLLQRLICVASNGVYTTTRGRAGVVATITAAVAALAITLRVVLRQALPVLLRMILYCLPMPAVWQLMFYVSGVDHCVNQPPPIICNFKTTIIVAATITTMQVAIINKHHRSSCPPKSSGSSGIVMSPTSPISSLLSYAKEVSCHSVTCTVDKQHEALFIHILYVKYSLVC